MNWLDLDNDQQYVKRSWPEYVHQSRCGNEGVLKRFVKDDFEDAKVQLEDDCILPALHDLIDYSTPPACSDAFPQSSESSPFSPFGRLPLHDSSGLQSSSADRTSPQADTESLRSTQQLVSIESSVGQTDCFDSDKLKTAAFHLDTEFRPSQPFPQSPGLDLMFPIGCLKQDPAAELSPCKSSDPPELERKPSKKSPAESGKSKEGSRELQRSSSKATTGLTERKALAKQRYREKNRKAQARHRERNKKTIEDLSAKNSALISEVANLKLELAIISTLAQAKDSTMSRMRRAKHDLKYTEAMELIRDSYQLVHGEDAAEAVLETWSLKESAAARQAHVERVAAAVSQGILADCNLAEAQELQMHAMQKRRISLEFAVGNPTFQRALYAFERAFSSRMHTAHFEDLWSLAVERIQFSTEQTTELLAARATLLNRARTIFGERQSIISAIQAGVSEGVADLLASSLEEERQAAFHFLFCFFDEIMTLPQDLICEVTVFPWMPDALAIADIVVDKAIAASPNGVEGLDLPSHLVSLKDGQLDLTAIATPVKQQVAELGRDADVSGVAAGLGLRWPDQTPLQMLSVPVTTSHCCTASISLLRNVLMFSEGMYLYELPAVPLESLFQVPILSMVKQRQQ